MQIEGMTMIGGTFEGSLKDGDTEYDRVSVRKLRHGGFFFWAENEDVTGINLAHAGAATTEDEVKAYIEALAADAP